MFDKKLFLSHHTNRQNTPRGANFDKVVVDSQGMRWGFDARKGIYENLNTGQRMNSVLFENTNLSNATSSAAAAGDSSSGWGVSNRSSDVNTPEVQARLTQRGTTRGKSFRQAEATLGVAASIVQTESFFPLDSVFYGRLKGPYFDDNVTRSDSVGETGSVYHATWKTTGGRVKAYFNPDALSGSTFTDIDTPGSGHIQVEKLRIYQIFEESTASNLMRMDVLFGSTTDAFNAYSMIWGVTGTTSTSINDYYIGAPVDEDTEGRKVFYARITDSGKTARYRGGRLFNSYSDSSVPNNGSFKIQDPFEQLFTGYGGAYAAMGWEQRLSGYYGPGSPLGTTGESLTGPAGDLVSRSLYIIFSGGGTGTDRQPFSMDFSINDSLTRPTNILYNNPNGVGSTTPFEFDFAFLKGTNGTTWSVNHTSYSIGGATTSGEVPGFD